MRKANQPKLRLVFLVCAVATSITAPAQTFSTLANLSLPSGVDPSAGLVQGTDGNFYGTTQYGGRAFYGCNSGCGTIFAVTPSGAITTLHRFVVTDGALPSAALLLGTDGNFYGTTGLGGGGNCGTLLGCGTIFRITPTGILKTLHTFCAQTNCTDGSYPKGALVQGSSGDFYGTTLSGGANGAWGTIFKITASGSLTILYSFCAQTNCTDGSEPLGGLTEGTDGNFYGTTSSGGNASCSPPSGGIGCGTVFKITPQGTLTTLYSFDGTDGSSPYSALVQGSDGNFYGSTNSGGGGFHALGFGTVFKISTAGSLTTLYNFCSQGGRFCTDGTNPDNPLIQATDGNFYGATIYGGIENNGTIFNITPGGALTTLHTFDVTDGSRPAGLVQGTDGDFYGTTDLGGATKLGTVFSLSMGLGPFVAFVEASEKIGQIAQILGQGLTGTTNVSFSGTIASFTVVSDTFLKATIPVGATTGYVTVTTPTGTLTSNVPFHVLP